MRLEDQVVSLELAKKLKELGVKQGESLFVYWTDCTLPFEYIWEHKRWEFILGFKSQLIDSGCKLRSTIDAFTVAELGEMLPKWGDFPKGFNTSFYTHKDEDGKWLSWGIGHDYNIPHREMTCETEADARAKLLIHLIEKDIIKP